jgi:glutaredoxin
MSRWKHAPWLAAALTGALAAGCRKPVPEAPAPQELSLPALEVTKDGKWLYTYVDASGAFATTDDPAAVPEGSRKLVRVLDPSRAASERRDGVAVYVVDVGALLRAGKAPARTLSRQAFETGALAQLPPGESSAWPGPSEPAAGGAAPGEAPPAAAPPAAAPGSAPVVTLYGTSWCGVCRQARQYLSARKIPFADKDIERDPAAAAELRAKAGQLGIPTDRVPILDVRGRLLLGFDKARLEALLGEAS